MTLDGRQGQHGDKTEWTTRNTPYLNHCSNYSILQFLKPAIVIPASYSPPGRNCSFPVLGYEFMISELQAPASWALLSPRDGTISSVGCPCPSRWSLQSIRHYSMLLHMPAPPENPLLKDSLSLAIHAYPSTSSCVNGCFAKVPRACRIKNIPWCQQKLL